MLKSIRLREQTLLIDWNPETVGRCLQQHVLDVHDLCQLSKQENKRLIKDLFLLSTRASISPCPQTRAYGDLLALYARRLKHRFHHQQPHTGESSMNPHTVTQPHTETPSLDGLQARLFRLMTQYSMHPCRHVASHIVQALTKLCQHPHIELLPEQRSIYSQSLNLWRARLLQPANGVSNHVH